MQPETLTDPMSDLRALAAKATPGPWTVDETWPDDVVIYTAEDKRWIVNIGNWSRQAHPDTHPEDSDYLRNAFEADADDARYIAACDPQTILGWIDRAERAEKALRETVEMLAYLWEAEGQVDGFRVRHAFADDDPLNEDVPKVIAAARAALESVK